MTGTLDERMTELAMETYLEWRALSVGVEEAYEERSSLDYAALVGGLSA